MKKNRLLPLLLLLAAVVVYGVWFGFFQGAGLELQIAPPSDAPPTLPSFERGEGADIDFETDPPGAATTTPFSSFAEPPGATAPPLPAETTASPASMPPGTFSYGAPATVATPPAWADDGLPHDKLFKTVARQKYQDKQLTLIIPKLRQTRPIFNGTDLATLNKGVGLFDYAQLPGEGNRNVSLAAHRNGRSGGRITDRAPFYYIDTLTTGHRMYLRDAAHVYEYVYKTTFIVEETDWTPIKSQGFSCLTLLSCEPIGVNTHRIIVQGELVRIHDVAADAPFDFQP